ncbi:uncharacterized protein LOC128893160, partial [Hylaeus anthracinus]
MYKIRKFAEFLGVLSPACPAVAYGFIHCKRLERQKFLALKFNGDNYEEKILISEGMSEDLNWWQINTVIGSNPIRTQVYSMEIFSDSSLSGWGCYCNGSKTYGFWNKKEGKNHINYLELLAAFFGIKCFASKLSQCEILLRLDNTTAISYINKAGGVRFPKLSKLSRKIWEWCEGRKIWLRASYIPSAENTEADNASRQINIDAEWELFHHAFTSIQNQFGSISVDLFTSRINKKCKKFFSRFSDPEASAIDAFTMSWKNEYFYAFPPFALILRTLRKIINDKALGIVRQEPSTSIPPFTSGRQVIWSGYLKQGLTEEVADVMVNSITNSTLKQYECHLRSWWEFSHLENLDIYNAKIMDIIKFLNKRYKTGANYSTLNTARSAISLISLYDINKDSLISHFLKGVFKQRPPKPRYATIWDVTSVLNYIENLHPLKGLKLKDAAEKVVTLLALTTAQRLKTLALINIDNINKSDTGINIKITDHIKTSKVGVFQPELILPFFKEKPRLCAATAVLDYLDCTKDLRNSVKRLFIATVKPFGTVSSQTIGHWIKTLLGKADVNTELFTAYSTRHTAVSKAHKRGIDISIIRRSAWWSPNLQ